MTISRDLFMAVLSMDAYNRNVLPPDQFPPRGGILMTGDLGTATVIKSVDIREQDFQATAWNWTTGGVQKTVIAYRGTDSGWWDSYYGYAVAISLGWTNSPQADLAQQFYHAITGKSVLDGRQDNVILTGHSLGGGLAGYVGLLSGSDTVIFNAMPFASSVAFIQLVDLIKGGGLIHPHASQIKEYDIVPEVLGTVRSNEIMLAVIFYVASAYLLPPIAPWAGLLSGYIPILTSAYLTKMQQEDLFLPSSIVNPITRHSISLCTLMEFSNSLPSRDWYSIQDKVGYALTSSQVGASIGAQAVDRASGNFKKDKNWSDLLSTVLAYSVIDEGVRPFGDTGVRAFFNDANEIGTVVVSPVSGTSALARRVSNSLIKGATQFAGALAVHAVTGTDTDVAQGIFQSLNGVLSFDYSDALWSQAFASATAPVERLGEDRVRAALLSTMPAFANLAKAMGLEWGAPGTGDISRFAIATDPAALYVSFWAGGRDNAPGDITLINAAAVSKATITGSSGRDLIVGSSGADTIYGGSGDDIIMGGAGNDAIYGGVGSDMLLLSGPFANYSFAQQSDGSWTVYDKTGKDGLKQLFGVERVMLSDGTVYRLAQTVSGQLSPMTAAAASPAQPVLDQTPSIISDGGKDRAAFRVFDGFRGITQVQAVAPTGGKIVYSIVGGADAALFAINSSSGSLSFKSAPSFLKPGDAGRDNVYDIVIQASNGTAFDQQVIQVTVAPPSDLRGTALADTLIGTDASERILGLAGDDLLQGGYGDDVYVYNRGDGNDTIVDIDWAGSDILFLGSGIATFHVSFVRQGDDVRLTIAPSAAGKTDGGSILLKGQGAAPQSGIDSIVFAEGTEWSWQTLMSQAFAGAATANDDSVTGTWSADSISGGAGNDTLSELEGNNTFNGGTGNDLLIGGSDDDRFVFVRGDGSDTLTELADGGWDTLFLGTGISSSQVSVTREGLDVRVTVAPSSSGASDGGSILIKNHLIADGAGIETVTGALNVSGAALAAMALQSATTVQNDTINGFSIADSIDGGAGDDVLLGFAGNDTLKGGIGNDTLLGGVGDDRFSYANGNGSDVIAEAPGEGFDELAIDPGIAASRLSVAREGTDVRIVIANSAPGLVDGGSILIKDQGSADGTGIEKVSGTVNWTAADLQALALRSAGTSAADSIIGFAGNDSIDAGAGRDTIKGLGGNDTIRGGDTDLDVIIGGDGNDLLYGGIGRDAFFYQANFGQDTIADFTVDDVLYIDKTLFADFKSVMGKTTQSGTDVLISWDQNTTIRLVNTQMPTITANNFSFF
jgi:Ca2+-binding RTX toxin-like protein